MKLFFYFILDIFTLRSVSVDNKFEIDIRGEINRRHMF